MSKQKRKRRNDKESSRFFQLEAFVSDFWQLDSFEHYLSSYRVGVLLISIILQARSMSLPELSLAFTKLRGLSIWCSVWARRAHDWSMGKVSQGASAGLVVYALFFPSSIKVSELGRRGILCLCKATVEDPVVIKAACVPPNCVFLCIHNWSSIFALW